jgi:hypothetical protein
MRQNQRASPIFKMFEDSSPQTRQNPTLYLMTACRTLPQAGYFFVSLPINGKQKEA